MKARRRFVYGFVSLMVYVVLTGTVMSQEPVNLINIANPEQANPETVMASFFSAINAQDYALAYSYWDQPSAVRAQTVEQFSRGYTDTSNVEAFFRLPADVGVAAGTVRGKVPTILQVTHNDGSLHYYTGCYMTRQSAVPTGEPPVQDWNFYITEGAMTEVPDANAAFDQLGQACVHVWAFCSGNIDCTEPIR